MVAIAPAVPSFAALAAARTLCAVKTLAVAFATAVLRVAVRPEAAVYELRADVSLDTAVAKRLDAEVTALLAVDVAVAKVVWAARDETSAADRVASKAELAVLVTARRDAAVDAAVDVDVTAAVFVDACVLTFVVVYWPSPPVVATCAWALSTKAVVAAAATPVKRTIFLFNILQFLNYAI